MRLSSLSYDKKSFWKSVFALLGLIAVMFPTSGAGFVVMIPVVIYASTTKKPELMFFSIMLCGISIITNNFFMPRNMVFFVVQRLIMLSVGLLYIAKSITARGSNCLTPFVGVMPYLIFSLFASMGGWNPLVSALKVILFVCSFYAYYGVANELINEMHLDNIARLRSILLAVSAFYIIGSVLVVPFPEISQLKGAEVTANTISLFKGMTTHSQCLGPVIASISIILFGDLLFSVRKMDWLYMLLLILCPYLIYKTSSRTGMASFIIGIGMVGIFFVRARNMSKNWKTRVTTLLLVLLALIGFVGTMSSTVRSEAMKFIMKQYSNRDQDIVFDQESMMSSRQFLIDKALDNFSRSPVVGNGFQVSQNMDYSVAGSSEFAKLLSAPIEKGVWIYAVLEEGGVIGMIIFCSFCVIAFCLLAKRKAYIAASLLVFMLVSNMAEFSMFSMSYTGGFIWAMIFIGATFDAVRNKHMMVPVQGYYGGPYAYR